MSRYLTSICAGSLPFLLKEHLSYSQIAVFSLASYPYSLKLLWSPIVDSLFIPSVGRRRSLIIPMQLLIGTLMLAISFNAEEYMNNVRVSPIPAMLGSFRMYSHQSIFIPCRSRSLRLSFFLPHRVCYSTMHWICLLTCQRSRYRGGWYASIPPASKVSAH